MQTKIEATNPLLTQMTQGLSKIDKSGAPNNAAGAKSTDKVDSTEPKEPFKEVLHEKVKPGNNSPAELKFSAHALSRLSSRHIELSSDEILKMQEAVQKAGQKGSKESLILTDKAAFIVSIKNNTVITAVDKASLKENLFTNIDSTIMI